MSSDTRGTRRGKWDITLSGGSSKRSKRRRTGAGGSDEDGDAMGGSDSAKHVYAKGNHIYFYAAVTKESVYKMNEMIVELNNDFDALRRKHAGVTMTPPPIYLHINSYGGSVFAAFAAIDFIQQSRIPVHTIVEGGTASSGTLMSVVGKKRYIRPHASMLIHQLSAWVGGKMTDIEESHQNLEQMMQTIKDIYAEHTTMTRPQLDELLRHDFWWPAATCLRRGLVDAIYADADADTHTHTHTHHIAKK